MDGPAANSSRTDDDKDDIEEFLGILEANFKGRKCYIGQYGLRTKAPEASEVNECPDSRPAVGSVVVTLEAREKLVIGAFISDEVDGEWEYWEGEFGPPELEAHRDSLGWDGHSLKTLGDCFTGAVDDTMQSSQLQSCESVDATAADEHQQQPPEFSSADDGGSDKRELGNVAAGGEESSTAATGTLDLHYAGAGIVGSWDIRRVQSGVSGTLMNSMQRSIRAACWRKPADAVEAPAAASGGGINASSSRPKSSGAQKAKRQRFAGKGATLVGAQSSAVA